MEGEATRSSCRGASARPHTTAAAARETEPAPSLVLSSPSVSTGTGIVSTGASASMGSRGCSGIVTFRSSTTRAVGGAVDAREVSYRERIGVVSREGIVVLFMRKMDDVFGLCAQVIIEVLTGDELDAASDG